MEIQSRIERKITEALKPAHLEVINESHMHRVPPGSESHFKVVVVSEGFEGKKLLDRQRAINAVLSEELKSPVHALALQTYTPKEWEARGGKVNVSPPCLGGSKP